MLAPNSFRFLLSKTSKRKGIKNSANPFILSWGGLALRPAFNVLVQSLCRRKENGTQRHLFYFEMSHLRDLWIIILIFVLLLRSFTLLLLSGAFFMWLKIQILEPDPMGSCLGTGTKLSSPQPLPQFLEAWMVMELVSVPLRWQGASVQWPQRHV